MPPFLAAWLAKLGLKDALWAAAVLALAVLAMYEHHHILQEGVAEQKARDAAQLEAEKKQQQDRYNHDLAVANGAAHAYDEELSQLRTYRDAHPDSVRLCVDSSSSGNSLPAAAGRSDDAVGSSASAGRVRDLPAGDNQLREDRSPDIGPMLDALAARADQVSAQLRQLQTIVVQDRKP